MRYIVVIWLLISVISSCSDATRTDDRREESQFFRLPVIPTVLNSDSLRNDFLVVNFWNNFDFKDTSRITHGTQTELAFSNFVALTRRVSFEKASDGLSNMMKRAEADSTTFSIFMNLNEKYLYDPNSDLRNESLYMVALEMALISDVTSWAAKVRYQAQLNLCQKNYPGNPATDFSYTLASGVKARMYAIKSKYLLLYFNNPGCDACQEVTNQLSSSLAIERCHKKGILKILSVYPDNDLNEWRAAADKIPAVWINAYNEDAVIKESELYDLKAIPTIYLLDAKKNVLLKDATPDDVVSFLAEQL